MRGALVGLAVRALIAGLLGGIAGALVARLSWTTAAGGAAIGALLVAALGLGSWATFREEAVAEPRYTGLLTRAPAAVGDIDAVLDRFGEYREQLSDLVDNMATLYLAGAELPVFETDSRLIRVLHVSDIHLNPQAFDLMERLTEQFDVDAVVDTGDITDWGTDPEAQLVDRIGELGVPYVYVRGNHDSSNTQDAVAAQPNAVVLDGDGATVAGLRFWGIGDPRYTPDKSEQAEGTEQERAEAFAPEVAEGLVDDEPPPVDVALVHDRRMAEDLGGLVPLVLAGHGHEPDEAIVEPPDPDEGSDDERHRRRRLEHDRAGHHVDLRRGRDRRGHAPAGRGLDRRGRAARPAGRGARTADGVDPLLRPRHPPARRLRPAVGGVAGGRGRHHPAPHRRAGRSPDRAVHPVAPHR